MGESLNAPTHNAGILEVLPVVSSLDTGDVIQRYTNYYDCVTYIRRKYSYADAGWSEWKIQGGGVKVVQRGVLHGQQARDEKENGFGYKDVKIAAVHLSKAVIHVNNSGTDGDFRGNAKLINSTTLRIFAQYDFFSGSSNFHNINWQVVEYN